MALSLVDSYLLASFVAVFALELVFALLMRFYHDTKATRQETVLRENAKRLRLESEAVLTTSTFAQSARISREAVKLEMEAEAIERERTDRATKTVMGRFMTSRLATR